MTRFMLICLGGAVGTGARYLLSGWMLRALGPGFPWGTLIVNVLGSYLVAVLMYAGVEVAALSPTARLVLSTGVMGGFTTYSAFSFETMRQLQDGSSWLAAVNVSVTLFGCLAACFLGWLSARWIFAS
jgi:CrcB protein